VPNRIRPGVAIAAPSVGFPIFSGVSQLIRIMLAGEIGACAVLSAAFFRVVSHLAASCD